MGIVVLTPNGKARDQIGYWNRRFLLAIKPLDIDFSKALLLSMKLGVVVRFFLYKLIESPPYYLS